jgi:predicted PurR-regulated permease PerM
VYNEDMKSTQNNSTVSKTRIEIDTKTFVRFWLVVIGFLAVGFALYSAQAALVIIGTSFFLALALSKPVNYLTSKLPSRSRVASTALAYLAVISLLGVIIFLVIPPLVGQTVRFSQNVPALVDSATQQYTGLQSFVDQYDLQPQLDSVVESVKNSASDFAAGLGSLLVSSIGSVISTITALILVLVLTFLMLVEGPTWLNSLWSVYRNDKKVQHHRKLLNKMYNIVTSYVVGQLAVSSIAGLVAGVSVFILSMIFGFDADLAIPSAVIVLVSSLVPMFGAMIGAFLVGFILVLNNLSATIAFLVIFILYQQVEANYISPTIQSKRIDLSALAILVSVTIGIYVLGIAGGILSIPIAGSIKVLLDDHFSRD